MTDESSAANNSDQYYGCYTNINYGQFIPKPGTNVNYGNWNPSLGQYGQFPSTSASGVSMDMYQYSSRSRDDGQGRSNPQTFSASIPQISMVTRANLDDLVEDAMKIRRPHSPQSNFPAIALHFNFESESSDNSNDGFQHASPNANFHTAHQVVHEQQQNNKGSNVPSSVDGQVREDNSGCGIQLKGM